MSLNQGVVDLATAIGQEMKTKQEVLVSGTNLKTLNGMSILGPGDINIEASSSSSFVYGVYNYNSVVSIPSINSFIPFVTTANTQNTFTPDRKFDNYTFLLKAGSVYKIEGGISSITTDSGIASVIFTFISKASGLDITPAINNGFFGYVAGLSGYVRNYIPNGYFKATEDTYLKMKVIDNTLISCTAYETVVTITEITALSVAGPQNVFIQSTEPYIATGEKALWIDTTGGNLQFWIKTGD